MVLPAIILLYFLRLKRDVRVVSSTYLWKKTVDAYRVNRPFQRYQNHLLLWLQLLAVLLLAGQPVEDRNHELDHVLRAQSEGVLEDRRQAPDARQRVRPRARHADAVHPVGVDVGESEGLRVCDVRDGAEEMRLSIEDSKTETGVRSVFVPPWAAEAVRCHMKDRQLAGTSSWSARRTPSAFKAASITAKAGR